MSYAIMRVEKLSAMGGIGKHNDRSYGGQTHSPENADESRVDQNLHWDSGGKMYTQKEWTNHTKDKPLSKRVNARIKEGYKLDRAIRKDAVKALEYLFASDNSKMVDIDKNDDLLSDWIKTNREFLHQFSY